MKKLLLVIGIGGPPLDYALPRISALAAVHSLVLVRPSPFNQKLIERYSASIKYLWDFEAGNLTDEIVGHAGRVAADALLTFSEFALVPVAQACVRLGIRGPGPNAFLARDKVCMRDAWHRAMLPSPRHYKVRSLAELQQAFQLLPKPFVLKDATGSGSVGCQVIFDSSDLHATYEKIFGAMKEAVRCNKKDYSESADQFALIAEEFIRASTKGWYRDEGYADFVSVEGLVADGHYHALAVTSRLKTLFPFTETSDQSPCVIPPDLQCSLADLAGRAINALGLENCATHTEIKLQEDGGLCLVETAARIGGMAIARQLDTVWGVDIVSLLVKILLGEPADIPGLQGESQARKAAASLAVIGADSRGHPWATAQPFDPYLVDWTGIAGEDVAVRVEWAQSGNAGDLIHPYDQFKGTLNYWGMLFVEAPDAHRLRTACLSIMDNLEQELKSMARVRPAALRKR